MSIEICNVKPDFSFPYVGIDLETTGLSPNTCEITEICAIEFDEMGRTGNKFEQLCKPMSGYIPLEVQRITNITWDMVEDKPAYIVDDVRGVLASFVGNRTLTGHNIDGFDAGFLRFEPVKTDDSLLRCREMWSQKRNNLKAACIRVGIGWDDSKAHRAEYDVTQHIKLLIVLWGMKDGNSMEYTGTIV